MFFDWLDKNHPDWDVNLTEKSRSCVSKKQNPIEKMGSVARNITTPKSKYILPHFPDAAGKYSKACFDEPSQIPNPTLPCERESSQKWINLAIFKRPTFC